MKQVLVVRTDLKCRKGKMMAQSAHASLMSYLSALGNRENFMVVYEWLQKHNQTKIVVGIDSEQELLELHKKAQASSIPCALVLDAAKTEFDKPTYTALGIGPFDSEKIDLLTGQLKLL